MVIAAHPDDEILGCGATVNKCTKNGAEVSALILSTGIASRGICNKDEIKKLRQNAKKAADIIGYKKIEFEDFPDNQMDSVCLLDVIKKINYHADMFKPNVIFTHHHGDLNIDHRVTFKAVITAFRPLSNCAVNAILCFETPSSTEWNFPYYKSVFSPNIFINVEENISDKVEALNCYESEIRTAPHPRSPELITAIARRWGSVIDLKYAEAFELIRTRIL
jgi:LmbE family N-acetylglucosaminyl deacetylase